MARRIPFALFLLLAVSGCSLVLKGVDAGDPDILTDYSIPTNRTAPVDGNFFTFTGTRSLLGAPPPTTFKISKITAAEFPALAGQSVSYSVLQYPAATPNGIHIHPRAAELLFLVDGTLHVGFVDTTNKLFSQTLQAGDMFVFPKGLIHFQYNPDNEKPALAISAFGSSSPGTISIPNSLFTTGIDDSILAKSFKTNIAAIQILKAGLAQKSR